MTTSILQAAEQDNAKPSHDSGQVVCIDLPGESARCWRRGKKLTVLLRKHRDVLITVKLSAGAQYSVSSDRSPFYSVRDKKFVPKGTSTDFSDGEQLHLWVSRSFSGHLILRQRSLVLGTYELSKLDPSKYGDDPRKKPAPFIISFKTDASLCVSASPTSAPDPTPGSDPHFLPTYLPNSSSSSISADIQAVHVIEVNKNIGSVPSEILKFFENGGEETSVDTDHEFTRNWLLAQIAGSLGYAHDNFPWLKELWNQNFFIQRVIHKNAGIKWYIVFKGNPRLRQFITGTRYGLTNEKVLAIAGGAGSAAGLREAGWDAAKSGLKKVGLIAVVFAITLDTAEWYRDYEEIDSKTGKRKKDFFDLFTKIGIDLAKAGISAALGSLLVGGAITAAMAAGVIATAPVALVVLGTIAAGVAIGITLDWLDRRFHITDSIAEAARAAVKHLEVKNPMDYGGYTSSYNNMWMFVK